jgi:hypothetical protein
MSVEPKETCNPFDFHTVVSAFGSGFSVKVLQFFSALFGVHPHKNTDKQMIIILFIES